MIKWLYLDWWCVSALWMISWRGRWNRRECAVDALRNEWPDSICPVPAWCPVWETQAPPVWGNAIVFADGCTSRSDDGTETGRRHFIFNQLTDTHIPSHSQSVYLFHPDMEQAVFYFPRAENSKCPENDAFGVYLRPLYLSGRYPNFLQPELLRTFVCLIMLRHKKRFDSGINFHSTCS